MKDRLWKQIRDARRRAGLTQEELGAACDPPVSKAAVGQWESTNPATRTIPKLKNLQAIASATGTPLAALTGQSTNTAKENNVSYSDINYRLIPLITWNQAATEGSVAEKNIQKPAETMIPCPAHHGPNAYALRVEGDSMTAPTSRSYPEGCIIFVDPDQASGAHAGDRVIAKLIGTDEIVFRQLAKDGLKLYLKALNQNHAPIFGDFRVVGKIIGTFIPE